MIGRSDEEINKMTTEEWLETVCTVIELKEERAKESQQDRLT